MWLVYLIALVLGGGVLLLQIIGGSKGDLDHGMEGHLHHDFGHHGPEPGIISTRAVVYALFTFGFVGGALHIVGLTSPGVAGVVAVLSGVAAGLGVGYVFAHVGHPEASGSAAFDEARGLRGRVLLACAPDRQGKIRLNLKGQTVDLRATSESGTLPEGTEVVVVDVRDDVARVAGAGTDAPQGVRS
jgi:membrane protein implicated in regulation of membrane protease activity